MYMNRSIHSIGFPSCTLQPSSWVTWIRGSPVHPQTGHHCPGIVFLPTKRASSNFDLQELQNNKASSVQSLWFMVQMCKQRWWRILEKTAELAPNICFLVSDSRTSSWQFLLALTRVQRHHQCSLSIDSMLQWCPSQLQFDVWRHFGRVCLNCSPGVVASCKLGMQIEY